MTALEDRLSQAADAEARAHRPLPVSALCRRAHRRSAVRWGAAAGAFIAVVGVGGLAVTSGDTPADQVTAAVAGAPPTNAAPLPAPDRAVPASVLDPIPVEQRRPRMSRIPVVATSGARELLAYETRGGDWCFAIAPEEPLRQGGSSCDPGNPWGSRLTIGGVSASTYRDDGVSSLGGHTWTATGKHYWSWGTVPPDTTAVRVTTGAGQVFTAPAFDGGSVSAGGFFLMRTAVELYQVKVEAVAASGRVLAQVDRRP